jgi:hypothetical protein
MSTKDIEIQRQMKTHLAQCLTAGEYEGNFAGSGRIGPSSGIL